MTILKRSSLAASLFLGLAAFSSFSQATVVQFKTSLGDFEVNLFDSTTPDTVANFLDYVNAEAYTNSIVHRSVPGFVVQGGGYYYDTETSLLDAIATNDAVNNEPELSNIRGTIAMAKGSDPDSARNQWFFNLDNNAANLDFNTGGFTVFGIVMGDGMEIIDAMAELDIYAVNPFPSLPLRSIPDDGVLTDEHYLVVESITVIDTNVDTNLDLLPPANTDTDTPTTPTDPSTPGSSGGGGGGSFGIVGLLGMLMLATRRVFKG